MVLDLQPGAASATIDWALVHQERLFFRVENTAGGLGGLWVSDGTEAGTHRIEHADLGDDGWPLGVLNDLVLFAATASGLGVELWATAGTADGTFLVLDINPGPSSSAPHDLVQVGDQVFFTATDSVHGSELWVSDGTADGTTLVRDIFPGTDSSLPSAGGCQLHGVNAVLDSVFYFRARDPDHGGELWRSDRTEANTYLVADINPGVDRDVLAQATSWGGPRITPSLVTHHELVSQRGAKPVVALV